MSIVHMTLERISDNENHAIYKVSCPDFNDSSQPEYFGLINIRKKEKIFTHENNELWIKNKIYPIHLFELSLEERKKEIESNYKNYGSGMWSIKLLSFIKKCINENNYPKNKTLTT